MKRYLTPAERHQLFSAAYKTNDDLAQRDYHLMSALYYSGCRISEFLAMSLADVWDALKTNYLYIPAAHRKGGKKDHSVLLTKPMRMHLVALLNMNPSQNGTDPLIAGRFGEALTARAVQLRFRHWATEAGITLPVSPHWMRHTRAMDIMRSSEAKEPLLIVKSTLGHASLNSTAIYSAPSREEIEQELEALDGNGGKRTTRAQLRNRYQRRAG
ncbi:tyrosine-type recombinase/integrase [Chromobacterium haemolyticum]|uniref:tyrosine-type recombinase/integrase n=1 Tax=Chromobacterium haemolyticum TaxID=394935 RepID=UPI000DEF4325|nr:tyrosine-type recombinase/integrase [Chromobacterium haemolyticum]